MPNSTSDSALLVRNNGNPIDADVSILRANTTSDETLGTYDFNIFGTIVGESGTSNEKTMFQVKRFPITEANTGGVLISTRGTSITSAGSLASDGKYTFQAENIQIKNLSLQP